MQPQQMSFGSGSQLLGGTSPFQQILQAQSQGEAGVIQQQMPGSAGFDPSTIQKLPTSSIQTQQQTPRQAMQAGQPMPQSFEAQTILDALANRLKHTSKMAEKKLEMGMPD